MNFTGPKVKKSRALGVALTPKAARIMKKRPSPPGQQGSRPRRRRPSNYAIQLLEKQRLRFQYNVSERYLQKTFAEASRRSGATGDTLILLLECRLDALVLRAGLAPTIFAARQYVTHGHVQVNGRKATIPSQRLKPGDVLSIKPRSRSLAMFTELRANGPVAPYLTSEDGGFAFRFGYLPERHEVPVVCDAHLVVEYYSR